MKLELDEIFSVINKVNEAELDSFAYKDADIKLSIKRKGDGAKESVRPSASKRVNPAPQIAQAADGQGEPDEAAGETKTEKTAGITIDCPMVGTFYTAPTKDKEPFVTEGDTVKRDRS